MGRRPYTPQGPTTKALPPSRAGTSGGLMKCRMCGAGTVVADSRPVLEGESVRRRRVCVQCSWRGTTYESWLNNTPPDLKEPR